MKGKFKLIGLMAFVLVACTCTCGNVYAKNINIEDEKVDEAVVTKQYEKTSVDSIEINPTLNKSKQISLAIEVTAPDAKDKFVDTGVEIEISTSAKFSESETKKYTLKINSQKQKYAYKLPVTKIGKNGNSIYVRARKIGKIKESKTVIYSKYYSIKKPVSFYKINDDNFKGLTKLLKSGYSSNNKRYDANKDGWLDEKELNAVETLTNCKVKKNGKKLELLVDDSKNQCDVTGFEGISLLPKLKNIVIHGFSNKVATIDKSYYNSISFYKVKGTEFVLDAKGARDISIDCDFTARKLKAVDVKKCTGVVKLYVHGTMLYLDVKLPVKADKLLSLQLENINSKKLDLNKYKNLIELTITNTAVKKLIANKCKSLRYVITTFSTNLGSVDISGSKKIKGVVAGICPQLNNKTVKTSVNCKKVFGQKTTADWFKSKDYKNNVSKVIKKAIKPRYT